MGDHDQAQGAAAQLLARGSADQIEDRPHRHARVGMSLLVVEIERADRLMGQRGQIGGAEFAGLPRVGDPQGRASRPERPRRVKARRQATNQGRRRIMGSRSCDTGEPLKSSPRKN